MPKNSEELTSVLEKLQNNFESLGHLLPKDDDIMDQYLKLDVELTVLQNELSQIEIEKVFKQNRKILDIVQHAIPYPNQIKNVDLTISKRAIRFEWRGTIYRVSVDLGVEEVQGCTLHGTDTAMLMGELLQKTAYQMSVFNLLARI